MTGKPEVIGQHYTRRATYLCGFALFLSRRVAPLHLRIDRCIVEALDQLQALGSEMVQTDTRGFCQAVLKDAGYSSGHGLVLDGIRHVDVLAVIKTLVGDQTVKLVYLDSSAADRRKRSSVGTERLQEIDSHPVERDAPRLKSVADLVLDTSKDDDNAFETLRQWVVQTCK